jgi:ketosteroid isomerase-like protein
VRESITDLVQRAYAAFARGDRRALREMCDPDLEFRPVDGLGLVGDVIHGLEPACAWVEARYSAGFSVSIWLRTLERVSDDCVLGVGVVSERGRTGGGYAATVAWTWRVRDGSICSVFGYPSEAEARRSLSERGF